MKSSKGKNRIKKNVPTLLQRQLVAFAVDLGAGVTERSNVMLNEWKLLRTHLRGGDGLMCNYRIISDDKAKFYWAERGLYSWTHEEGNYYS